VLAELAADPSGRRLGKQLSTALDRLARHSQPFGRRCTMEFGVWNGDYLSTPDGCPVRWTRLPKPWKSSEAVIKRLRPRQGQVAGYFRWLDSGDVNVGTHPRQWVGFVHALGQVARAFPKVLFWLPTRSYFVPQVRAALVQEAKRSRNLIVRPSGYTTCAPPPMIPGLAAGTSVVDRKQEAPPADAWGCPAYLGSKGATCLSVGCRMCWVNKQMPVWYPLH
jgi:hypothetical protein